LNTRPSTFSRLRLDFAGAFQTGVHVDGANVLLANLGEVNGDPPDWQHRPPVRSAEHGLVGVAKRCVHLIRRTGKRWHRGDWGWRRGNEGADRWLRRVETRRGCSAVVDADLHFGWPRAADHQRQWDGRVEIGQLRHGHRLLWIVHEERPHDVQHRRQAPAVPQEPENPVGAIAVAGVWQVGELAINDWLTELVQKDVSFVTVLPHAQLLRRDVTDLAAGLVTAVRVIRQRVLFHDDCRPRGGQAEAPLTHSEAQ